VSQSQWLTLALKVALIAGFCSLTGWTVLYTVYADWWKNAVGRTLVAKTILIALLFVPTALGLFFQLNRADSYLVGWIDASLIGLVTPTMLWRSAVWVRLHRAGQLARNGGGGKSGAAQTESLEAP
jgi:hypothetical protein